MFTFDWTALVHPLLLPCIPLLISILIAFVVLHNKGLDTQLVIIALGTISTVLFLWMPLAGQIVTAGFGWGVYIYFLAEDMLYTATAHILFATVIGLIVFAALTGFSPLALSTAWIITVFAAFLGLVFSISFANSLSY
jgi:hypothetical protein